MHRDLRVTDGRVEGPNCASVDVQLPDGTVLEYTVDRDGDYELWAVRETDALVKEIVSKGMAAFEAVQGHA